MSFSTALKLKKQKLTSVFDHLYLDVNTVGPQVLSSPLVDLLAKLVVALFTLILTSIEVFQQLFSSDKLPAQNHLS